MLGAFQLYPRRHGYYTHLDHVDNRLIRQLIAETLMVLDEPITSATLLLKAIAGDDVAYEQPQEVALQKLLPPMSSQPGEASSLRALTEDSLRREKSLRLRRLSQDLQSVVTDDDCEESNSRIFVDCLCAWEWLVAINDLRLVLAGELEVQGMHLTNNISELLKTALDSQQEDVCGNVVVGEIRALDLSDIQNKMQRSGLDEHCALLSATYVILTWWQVSLLTALPK